MSYSLEMKMLVYDDNEGTSIEIRQWPDAPDNLIEIHTNHHKESKEFYGSQSLVLSHDQIEALIQALHAVKAHQIQ